MLKYKVRVYSNGTTEWHLNGQLHREDGPAIERSDGSKEWYLNGQLHREDGPAIENSDGSKEWYLNGCRVTETDVMTEEMTVAQVCKALGRNVKIVK